jgi:hypothetical protein
MSQIKKLGPGIFQLIIEPHVCCILALGVSIYVMLRFIVAIKFIQVLGEQLNV